MEIVLYRKPAFTKDLRFVSPAIELPCCIEKVGYFYLLVLRRLQTF
jgi:hypothetical protein